MPQPEKAHSPETQCLARTLHHKQCLLHQSTNSKLCPVHQQYPEKLLAKIQSPNFFEGFVPNWRDHERKELEAAIKNNLLEIPHDLLQSLPQAIIYGPFYNWYCGVHLKDPWIYPHLATSAIKDAVRVHTHMLECGHKPNVCKDLQGILEAQAANPASTTQFLWDFLMMLHRYRKMTRQNQEEAIEQLLESKVVDNHICHGGKGRAFRIGHELEPLLVSCLTLTSRRGALLLSINESRTEGSRLTSTVRDILAREQIRARVEPGRRPPEVPADRMPSTLWIFRED